MVRRCAYDGDGGTSAARAFAASTTCGRKTALPAQDYIYHIFSNHPPARETAPISVPICSPSQFAHLHRKSSVSVRVISTSVSLTAERPFRLEGTHVIPILFGSQFTIDVRLHDPHRLFFFGPKLERNRTWETSLDFFLYLPPSIGSLLTVRSRFFFAAERRRTRAIFERHHARAASEFIGWKSSLPFFSMLFGFTWFILGYNKYRIAVPRTYHYTIHDPKLQWYHVEKVQYIHRYSCLFVLSPARPAKQPFLREIRTSHQVCPLNCSDISILYRRYIFFLCGIYIIRTSTVMRSDDIYIFFMR